MELWKNIEGYNGDYLISNQGGIKSLRKGRGYGKILTKVLDTKGYHRVRLYYSKYKARTHKVHRLVAIHFIDNPDNKPEVNHKDGDKINNFDSNLEWNTTKENCQHRGTLGKWKPQKGTSHGMAILTDEQALEIYELSHNSSLTQAEIGVQYGVGYATVSNIKRGVQWNHLTKHKTGE